MEGKGPCAISAKWLNERPLVGYVVYPRQEYLDGRTSRNGGEKFDLRTIPVLEVPEEGEEAEVKRAKEVFPALELRPGQPVLLRSTGRDFDRLRVECSDGRSKDLLLDDPLVFRWEARWISGPMPAFEGLAQALPLSWVLESLRGMERSIMGLSQLLGASRRGREEELRREAKALLQRHGEAEWLSKEVREILAIEDLEKVALRMRSIEDELNSMKQVQGELENLLDAVKSIVKAFYELNPNGKLLGNGGSTVIFIAPHAEGLMELECNISDSGMQYPDGGVKVKRYISISGAPPWLMFLGSMNHISVDLLKVESVLGSQSWADLNTLWGMFEYLCHMHGLRGLRAALDIPLEPYERDFTILLGLQSGEKIGSRLKDTEGVMKSILKDLSVKDAIELLLRFLNLVNSERFVLNITMGWREVVSFLFLLGPLMAFDFLPAGLMLRLVKGLGGELFAAYDLLTSGTLLIEGAPQISLMKVIGETAKVVSDLESFKNELNRITAKRIASLLEEYGKAYHDDGKKLLAKMMNEVSASLLSYLAIYLRGRIIARMLYDERCGGEAKQLNISSELSRMVSMVVNIVLGGEGSREALKELGFDPDRFAESIRWREHDAIEKLVKRLIEWIEKIAKEATKGPGLYQAMREQLMRDLEADLFLLSAE